MTMAAAGAARARSGTAVARRTTTAPARPRARVVQGRVVSSRTDPPPRGTRARARPGSGGDGESPRQSPAGRGSTRQRRAARSYQSVRRTARRELAPEMRNYQGIILAEFVAAELLVAMTPIAARKNQPGLSPYLPADLIKLVAIGGVYLILELLAVGGRGPGRVGAWFGGLVLLVVGLNETANLARVFGLLSAGKRGQPKVTTTAADSTPPALAQFAGMSSLAPQKPDVPVQAV